MQIFEGHSNHHNAVKAIDEAVQGWTDNGPYKPDIIFVFHSSDQNSDDIAAELIKRYPASLIAGCTTAGEWCTGQYQKGSLVLCAISSDKIKWSLEHIESLNDFSTQKAQEIFDSLLGQLNIGRSDLTPKRHFCIGLTDGLVGLDGTVAATMANELGNVPFLGGVAGDDLKFEKTQVISNGKAYAGGAVFVLAECDIPFYEIKHQHFIPDEVSVVVSKAVEDERRVLRLDGMPAAERYAQLIGHTVEDLNFQIFSEHPVIYRHGNENYVRTIYQVGEDNSLIFYCTVEEGMVLNLCKHQDMSTELDNLANEIIQGIGSSQLLLMCNCSFRSLEADGKNQNQKLAKIAAKMANHVIGFDTYGELWNGLHMNQTLVALAIGQK